jgi:hypothetical protein
LAKSAAPVLLERQKYYVGPYLSRNNYFLNILLTRHSRVKFLDFFHKNYPKSGVRALSTIKMGSDPRTPLNCENKNYISSFLKNSIKV